MKDKIRIDTFLWAVRIFKTRSKAADACKKGHIFINGMQAKPSKEVKTGDIIKVKEKIIFRQYEVLQLLDKRVGAKLVENHIKEITPEEDLLKLKLYYENLKSYTPKFKGRPTKKDRRDIDKFLNSGW